jgi:hypothetical protein
MSEPIGSGGLVDVETALRREVDILEQRFPTVDRAQLERTVRATYDELKHDAEVESHLLAVTRAQVTEKLREQGAEIHVRSEGAGTDEAG